MAPIIMEDLFTMQQVDFIVGIATSNVVSDEQLKATCEEAYHLKDQLRKHLNGTLLTSIERGTTTLTPAFWGRPIGNVEVSTKKGYVHSTREYAFDSAEHDQKTRGILRGLAKHFRKKEES